MAENGGLAGQGGPRRPPWARFLFLRSVQVVAGFWVLATIAGPNLATKCATHSGTYIDGSGRP
jgi:hypothetical protein